VVLLVLTAITLITLDQRGTGTIDTVRSWARDIKAPIEDAANNVTSPVSDWFDGITRAGSLKHENATLRKQLSQARGDEARNRNAARENKRLTKLLHLSFAADVPSIASRVVDGAPSNFENTIVIDRGTAHGVAKGMPVVSGDGLVGRVTEVSKDRATVLLLTDREFGVGALLQDSGEIGVANGIAGRKTLSLDFIDAAAKVKKGETVVTSGREGGRFPPGIPIARVSSVQKHAGDLQQSIALAPLVDFDRLEFVKVLRWPTTSGG
jgi:rod shape-determining protein MreC